MKKIYYSNKSKRIIKTQNRKSNPKHHDNEKNIFYLGEDTLGNEVYIIHSKNTNEIFVKILQNIISEIIEDEDTKFISF